MKTKTLKIILPLSILLAVTLSCILSGNIPAPLVADSSEPQSQPSNPPQTVDNQKKPASQEADAWEKKLLILAKAYGVTRAEMDKIRVLYREDPDGTKIYRRGKTYIIVEPSGAEFFLPEEI